MDHHFLKKFNWTKNITYGEKPGRIRLSPYKGHYKGQDRNNRYQNPHNKKIMQTSLQDQEWPRKKGGGRGVHGNPILSEFGMMKILLKDVLK